MPSLEESSTKAEKTAIQPGQDDVTTGTMNVANAGEICLPYDDLAAIKNAAQGENTQVTDVAGNVYLLPRPSRSPNDPLNWSVTRKYVVLGLLCWYYALAVSNAQFLSYLLPQLIESFPTRPFADINLIFTITPPLVAPGDIIFAFTALKWGMRPTILLSLVIFIVSNLIGAINPNDFTQILVCRILAGIGCAPSDALAFILVENFTFIHERGFFMAILAFIGGGLNSLLCVALSWIAIRTSLRWAYVFYTVGSGVALIGLWFFLPETNFKRNAHEIAEPITTSDFPQFRRSLGKADRPFFMLNPFQGYQYTQKWTFKQSVNWLLWATIHPATWWLGAFQIITFGGLSAVGTYLAIILESPPWSWAAANVSFINFVIVPIAILGVLMGMLSDWTVLKMAQRRGGQPKPEDRLLLTPFPTILGIAGYVGFGAMAQAFYAGNAPGWFACVFCYFLTLGSFFFSIQLSSTYMAGSTSSEHALAKFSMLSAIRDLGSFGLSYGIVPFVDEVGYLGSFGTYGGLVGLLSSGAIPMYIYGENIRQWVARSKYVPNSR